MPIQRAVCRAYVMGMGVGGICGRADDCTFDPGFVWPTRPGAGLADPSWCTGPVGLASTTGSWLPRGLRYLPHINRERGGEWRRRGRPAHVPSGQGTRTTASCGKGEGATLDTDCAAMARPGASKRTSAAQDGSHGCTGEFANANALS